MTLFSSHTKKVPVLDDVEKLAWLRLFRTENVGPITFYQLIDNFGSAQKAIEALPTLARRGGRLKNISVYDAGNALNELEAIEKLGGQMIFAAEELYPLSLSAIDDAPPVISVLGNPKLMNKPCIGIVGARNASLNGRKFAEKISHDLGQAGQVVVSGLARGIDASAHTGALPFGTVACVAGGVDAVYPPENAKLYEQIKFEGCIVAESPLGMEPMAKHFPKRNRIISGLSSGIVIVEATLKSGSLITARMAAEQGRDVYAIPGHPFDPRASGPNKLIQDGATLVQNADDILQNIHDYSATRQSLSEGTQTAWRPADLSENEVEEVRDIILQNLSSTPVTVDELVRNCHLTVPAAQMVLLELELAGRIQRLPANRIVLLN
jgi:DNA processing protein